MVSYYLIDGFDPLEEFGDVGREVPVKDETVVGQVVNGEEADGEELFTGVSLGQ